MNYALQFFLKNKISNFEFLMKEAYQNDSGNDIIAKCKEDLDGGFVIPFSSCSVNYLNIFKEVVLQDCYRLENIRGECPERIFDIGANIGSFSFFAKILWPNAIISAAEPEQEAYAILIENFSNSSILRACKTFNVALSEFRGCGFILKDPTNAGAARLSTEGQPIETITYTDMVSISGFHPDLVKIDIEGEERKILISIAQISRPKIILLEWHLISKVQNDELFLQIKVLNYYGYKTTMRYFPRSRTYQIEAIQ